MARERIHLDSEAIVHRYLEGTSVLALSREFGVSKTPILHRLRKAGIALRSQSEAEALKWSRMSPDQRSAQTKAAHDAARGSKRSTDSLATRAKAMERRAKQNRLEKRIQMALRARGLDTIAQKAIGPYNVDLAARPVAIEVWGGSWHFSGAHAQRTPKRIRYLLNRGWHVLMLWNQTLHRPLDEPTLDYAVDFVHFTRVNPDAAREYRVLRGGAELVASGCADDDQICFMPNTRNERDPVTGRFRSVPR